MASLTWNTTEIQTDQGKRVKAKTPVIISASRSTDIPAFFPKWFMNRLRRGYIRRVNPFNRESEYVSFSATRVIVFWSKNPQPLIPFLSEIEDRGINHYVQFTLNDYEQERLEPHVPPLARRIETFQRLSERIGKNRVVWRFDPLILTDELTVDRLVGRVASIAEQIKSFTERLVISFADIAVYTKVRNNLAREHVRYREFDSERMIDVARRLQLLSREWGLKIATCAETVALESYGIEHSRCIDDRLMIDAFGHDRQLMEFLGHGNDWFAHPSRPHMEDKGQRKACGCVASKDIGRYRTCPHRCAYCYATGHPAEAVRNFRAHRPEAPEL